MKRVISILMSIILIFACCSVTAFAKDDPEWIVKLRDNLVDGKGPEVNGIAIDYVSYAPINLKEGTKYPLVILLHGMGQGTTTRDEIVENYFPAFTSDEMQSKFTNGGAFIFVPRSDESENLFSTWTNDEVEPLYEAIQSYIALNKDYIDTTRIYIGGYSMGGKMTIKMISTYPEMFAAAFPMCPAYIPSNEQLEAVSNMPLWLMCSRFDVLAGYYTYSKDIWSQICSSTKVPSDCRISVFGKVCFPDGTKTDSNHHVWFAASNDMFTYEKCDYPNMVTTDATGKEVKLTYPNGLISWLCSYTSEYDGSDVKPTNLVEENTSTVFDMAGRMIKALACMFEDTIKSGIKSITK